MRLKLSHYYIFDYGATIDTPGIHWGMMMWHAYEAFCASHEGLLQDLTEERFREAYVYAERYLGSHDVIKPEDTFYTTLEKKIDLQLEFLCGASAMAGRSAAKVFLLDRLYNQTKRNVAESKAVLEELRRRGKVLGLVSNFYGNIAAVLKEFGLSDLFSAVVESATEGIRKPDPALLRLCMERLGGSDIASQTIVVGDHLTKDIQPAKLLGCTAVWIKGEPWSNEHDALDTVQPDYIICSLKEL